MQAKGLATSRLGCWVTLRARNAACSSEKRILPGTRFRIVWCRYRGITARPITHVNTKTHPPHRSLMYSLAHISHVAGQTLLCHRRNGALGQDAQQLRLPKAAKVEGLQEVEEVQVLRYQEAVAVSPAAFLSTSASIMPSSRPSSTCTHATSDASGPATPSINMPGACEARTDAKGRFPSSPHRPRGMRRGGARLVHHREHPRARDAHRADGNERLGPETGIPNHPQLQDAALHQQLVG
ncbi:hypothetical protein QBC34DRAFT_437363, partial [Podospora aff. communis PSN243]